MGLFGKKPPCPICGGKIGWLMPSKIEDEYICSDCYAKIDMQDEIKNSLTMQKFREYLGFYEKNCLLRDRFVISQTVDFGWWDTKLIFDYENHLFCLSKNPDKTIFEGKDLVSFVIKEDTTPLFKGTANGIKRYESSIPEKAMALAPRIDQYIINRQMMENLERMTRDKDDNTYRRMPTMDIPEPFKKFNVELRFDHPYWNSFHCDMNGPTFSDTYPDVNDYIRSYQNSVKELEILVDALREVAFPKAMDENVRKGALEAAASLQAETRPVDAIEEIRKYKGLLEEGIITDEEFQAKKKEIMGI